MTESHNPKTAEELARQLQRQHGTSYYLATKFFPKRIRLATHMLYAFVRVPDEIVDNPENPEHAAIALETWIARWRASYAGVPSNDLVIDAAAALFHEYTIPLSEGEDFLAAMVSDLKVSRYETYEDLRKYMYGSAAVVGRMMTRIIGYGSDHTEVEVFSAADALGYAMQLTNFLRDIDEDYVQRGRVYLPQDEMRRFGITDDTIARREFTPEFEKLMSFQIYRAREYYQKANSGISLLNPDGRRAVRIASYLYAGILNALETQDSNPFAGRARTSPFYKLQSIAKAYITR